MIVLIRLLFFKGSFKYAPCKILCDKCQQNVILIQYIQNVIDQKMNLLFKIVKSCFLEGFMRLKK